MQARETMRKGLRTSGRVYRLSGSISSAFAGLLRSVFLLGASFVILYPVLVKLSASLMSASDVYDQTVQWIPKRVTFSHYVTVFEHMDYSTASLNSFLLAAAVAGLQPAACTMVGYGFARFRAALSGPLFACVIFTLIVPPQMIMIPLYLNFRFFDLYGILPGSGLNLLGTYWPVVLMSMTGTGFRNGLFIYILRQYFRGMPKDLEEAAYVDGAGALRTFISIMLPGAAPALVVVFLFAFVWQWNDYFYTTVLMSAKNLLTNRLDQLALSVMGPHQTQPGPYMTLINNTGCLLFIAPLLILYAFLQRYFVESVERTGLVG